MALRTILEHPDPQLKKISKPVIDFDNRLHLLLDDLIETMQNSNGVGLAAPQVGILRRVVVIEVDGKIYELINPAIVSSSGKQRTEEGCLSCPNIFGYTVRPSKVTVKAQDRHGKVYKVKGTELLAKALCHEIDHLNGILFLDNVVEYIDIENIK